MATKAPSGGPPDRKAQAFLGDSFEPPERIVVEVDRLVGGEVLGSREERVGAGPLHPGGDGASDVGREDPDASLGVSRDNDVNAGRR